MTGHLVAPLAEKGSPGSLVASSTTCRSESLSSPDPQGHRKWEGPEHTVTPTHHHGPGFGGGCLSARPPPEARAGNQHTNPTTGARQNFRTQINGYTVFISPVILLLGGLRVFIRLRFFSPCNEQREEGEREKERKREGGGKVRRRGGLPGGGGENPRAGHGLCGLGTAHPAALLV